MIADFDKQGFSCYSTSRAGLFKWSGGCMPEKFMGAYRAKDKGNIFCLSRRRAPMATLAYDILSFPLLVEQFADALGAKTQTAGAAGLGVAVTTRDRADAVLAEQLGDLAKVQQVQPGSLTSVYLHIKPFCQPWPTCAAV